MARNIDTRDLKILSMLQTNARISNVDLAEKVDLSAAACWERVRKLEDLGYIRQYRCEIALEKLPDTIYFMLMVTLKSHRTNDFSRFEAMIQKSKNIVNCVALGGGPDYILEVVVLHIDEYKVFLSDFLERNNNVKTCSAHVVTKNVKSSTIDLRALYEDQP